MTQDILADRAGMSREHLSELENGHKEIGIRTLERIVEALDMDFQGFFDGIKIQPASSEKDDERRPKSARD